MKREPEPVTEPAPDRDLSSPLDGDDSRRDEGVRSMGFRQWLKEQKRAGNPSLLEFIDYWKTRGVRWPITYSVEGWSEVITKHWPEKSDEVTALMVQAEAVWRAEQVSSGLTAEAYGIAPVTMANKLTHRIAQPDVKCGYTEVSGRACGDEVVPGSNRCIRHGGALVDPETRRAMLLSSYASLVQHSQTAVDVLVDVAQHSRNDLARVAASKEILDRVGLTPDLNITVTVEGGDSSPVSKLKKRLDEIAERLGSPGAGQAVGDIIDATVVSDDGEVLGPDAPPPAADTGASHDPSTSPGDSAGGGEPHSPPPPASSAAPGSAGASDGGAGAPTVAPDSGTAAEPGA